MCAPNLKSVAVDIAEILKKCQNLKVGHCDLDYVFFDLLLAVYLSLITAYLLAKFAPCSFSC